MGEGVKKRVKKPGGVKKNWGVGLRKGLKKQGVGVKKRLKKG